jgi:nucleoside diphosphate kinase
MNGMSTWHFMRSAPGGKEIFLTDGTIGLVLPSLAVVIVVEGNVNAHATIVAVLEILGTTDATKATIGTMVGAFFVGHP